MFRRAFTLVEVNMAIAIMMGGVLTFLSLYTMGFREARQNREDVTSAAFADAVISPLVNAVSATNLTWDAFDKLETLPASDAASPGWEAYLDSETGLVARDPTKMAVDTFNEVLKRIGKRGEYSYPSEAAAGMLPGLVVVREKNLDAVGGGGTYNDRVLKIAFRASRTKSQLMMAPLYYTEVRFQGVIPDAK